MCRKKTKSLKFAKSKKLLEALDAENVDFIFENVFVKTNFIEKYQFENSREISWKII
jgi:hypothetical protein